MQACQWFWNLLMGLHVAAVIVSYYFCSSSRLRRNFVPLMSQIIRDCDIYGIGSGGE
jgi:hypothetical protein